MRKKPFSLLKWLELNSFAPGFLFLRLPLVVKFESITRFLIISQLGRSQRGIATVLVK